MPILDKSNLEEAIRDMRSLRDPGFGGGFNLSYGDNYYAESLVRKWGMSLAELERRIKELKGIAPAPPLPKAKIRPVKHDTCGICGSPEVRHLGLRPGDGTAICKKCDAHWWNRWFTAVEWEAYVNEVVTGQ